MDPPSLQSKSRQKGKKKRQKKVSCSLRKRTSAIKRNVSNQRGKNLIVLWRENSNDRPQKTQKKPGKNISYKKKQGEGGEERAKKKEGKKPTPA